MSTDPPAQTVADRLAAAVNAHDVDRIVGCFTEDYLNETPVHPARGFRGRDQVRRNWTQILAAVPDIEATVVQADQVGRTCGPSGRCEAPASTVRRT